ncbi:hypothetical protein [Sphingobacterium multivorum]|uniref:hypothetical protein n=1 Tax=Sphingobacterium multivorum TaxID=28454 RepID=UPI003DA58D70
MITANQLRIGNYVASDHFKDRDVIVKVRLIGQEQAIVEHPNGLTEPMLYQGEMRPIKLTEEILFKCGFEKKNGGWHILNLINDWTFIFYQPLHGVAELSINKHGAILSDQCKYLHQLQNLFYALTGKELEIKF